MGLFDGFLSLKNNTNKVKDTEVEEGRIGVLLPELNLSKTDEELIEIKKQWENEWVPYELKLSEKQKINESYWLGEQFDENLSTLENGPISDNRLFSSFETLLPIATKQNPEPLVESTDDKNKESVSFAEDLKKMLAYQADIQSLKLILKKATRFWGLYKLGVIKVGWDMKRNDIATVVPRTQRIMVDPNSTIDEQGYTGEFVGEILKTPARLLVDKFPSKRAEISQMVQNKMGTKIQYVEWWTEHMVFWTLKDVVLDKAKNPHWNYEKEETVIDEMGLEETRQVRGYNHFKTPQIPYIFLSVFNLGKQPHDDTSLFEQAISLQKMVDRRMLQIDNNVKDMNGGIAVSGDHYTKEQAAQVSDELRNGGTLFVPRGDVRAAFMKSAGNPLPGDVFQSLNDARNEIDNIMGTHATTRGERGTSETARGRILLKSSDESRIGGGITEYIEQVADKVFNWWVQLMTVYYDEEHIATVLGKERARETIRISKDRFKSEMMVSVKEGSLLPKDSMTKRNEAIDLWGAGALDPITLFDRLEFPNPRESAMQLFTWQSNPAGLFQEEQGVQVPMEQMTEPLQIPPQTEPQSDLSQLQINQ